MVTRSHYSQSLMFPSTYVLKKGLQKSYGLQKWHHLIPNAISSCDYTILCLTYIEEKDQSVCHIKLSYCFISPGIEHKSCIDDFIIFAWCFFVNFRAWQLQSPFTFTILKRASRVFFKNSPVLLHGRKKDIQVWRDMSVSKYMRIVERHSAH